MELTARAATPIRLRRFSFVQEIVLAATLVTLADHLFFFQRAGATLGLFAAALLIALLAAHRSTFAASTRRTPPPCCRRSSLRAPRL